MRSLRVFALAAVVAGTVALPTVGASAATLHPTKEFITPTVTLATSTGVKVHFSIDMLRNHGATIDVDLDKSLRHSEEDHDWTFSVDGSRLAYSKGKGTLLTGNELGNYGSLRLSFAKVSQSTRSCSNASGAKTSVTNVKASVKGIVVFRALSSAKHASRWGVVRRGTSTSKYHFGYHYAHYIVTTNGSCRGSVPSPGTAWCTGGTSWDAPPAMSSTTMRSVGGDSGDGLPASIIASRYTQLGSPAGTIRADFIGVDAPDPVIDTSGTNPTLNVTTSAGSLASGSAMLSATDAGSAEPTEPCNDSGTRKTQSVTDYSANYTNGSTPLTVTSNVGSSISIADNAKGEAGFSTFSYA